MATTDRLGSAEEGEACLGCQRSRSDVTGDAVSEVKLASALLRKAMFLMLGAMVMFVLAMAVCCCSIYLYYNMNAMRTEILAAKTRAGDNYDYAYDAEYLVGDPDYQNGYDPLPADTQTDTATVSRIRRKKGNKGKGCRGGKRTKAACKCCERKVRSLIQSGAIAIPTIGQAKKPTTQPPTTKAPPAAEDQSTERHFFGAAHYTTTVDNDFIRGSFPPIDPGNLGNIVKCKNVTEWNGKLCRNRTFSSPAAPTTLKMFKEAGWMANVTRIFDLRQDGSFVARYTGIYLLYAHAQFILNQRLGIALVHYDRDRKEIKDYQTCDNSTLPVNGIHNPCSVTIVTHVNKRDIIQVQLLDMNKLVKLKDLYFGAFSNTQIFAS